MKSQLTGERAETKVRDVLLDGEIFCSKYEHDRGEDLLIELEAYTHNSKAGSGPRVASLQIKGHEADPDSDLDASFTKRRLSLNHLRRWAAMPLPVFIVAVEIVDSSPIFFARAIDELLGEIAPEGLGAIEKNTITVRLPRKNDLPAFLKAEISSFYSLNAFQLSELSESVIARNHYEVISQSTRFVPPTAKVWLKDIRVLWKGAWRPAHF